MANESHDRVEAGEAELPAALARALRELDAPPGMVPTDVDARVLASARRRMAWRRRFAWRVAAVGALAAAVVIVFLLPEIEARFRPEPVAPPVVVAIGDIDGNGRIDILDALHLARRIEASVASRPEWDVNEDGAVDRADVDEVAMRAVRINGGSPS